MNIQILNKSEAATLAGVDPKTIYQWVNKGYLNKYFVKGRKTFKISQQELEEHMRIIALGDKCHVCEENAAVKIDGVSTRICVACACKQ